MDRHNMIPQVIHVLQVHLGLFALGVITEQVAPLLRSLHVPYPSDHSSPQGMSSPAMTASHHIQSGHCALCVRKGKGSGLRDSLIDGRCRIRRRFAVSRFPHSPVIRSAARMRNWLVSCAYNYYFIIIIIVIMLTNELTVVGEEAPIEYNRIHDMFKYMAFEENAVIHGPRRRRNSVGT